MVGDDAQAVAIGRQLEHGLGEVATMRTDDPAGSQDQVALVGVRQSEFAVALGKAVNALRVGGIVFSIGALLGAVEDIVGGVVDDEGSELGGLLAKNARRDGVDRGSALLIALRLVDRSIGSGVDDESGHLRLSARLCVLLYVIFLWQRG